MKADKFIRVLAGSFVLISLALGHWVSEWWLLLTAFVGFNLIQSAFTGFCPPEMLARKLGWIHGECCCNTQSKSEEKSGCCCGK